uniref:SCP domain-containing protein n=1 Tax=Pipistrellus kuhlii TaxID=59472 RepID=A0A7J7ZHT8_PIPKU|nr:hypothetical protein mPipKuh1_005606 [Pipistrellus kuhlii]
MVYGNKLNFLWTLGFYLIASQSSPSVPSIEDKSFIRDCVEAHNEMRRTVHPSAANMKYMSWDKGLAMTAKAWANKCQKQPNTCTEKPYLCHPTFKYVGENIWLDGSYQFKPESAIGLWNNEKMNYNYSIFYCSEVCDHYTQVVWADSYKVGCAMRTCPLPEGASTAIFVCDYGPLGNNVGERPYKEGYPCSSCGKKDTCEKSLCKYSNWNPQGKASQWTACNILYIVCILLRMF